MASSSSSKSPAPQAGPKATLSCRDLVLVTRMPGQNWPGCSDCRTVTNNARVSANPIRYWDGAIYLTEADIVTPYGGLFSQVRCYNNRTSTNYQGPNGFNWFVPQKGYDLAHQWCGNRPPNTTDRVGSNVFLSYAQRMRPRSERRRAEGTERAPSLPGIAAPREGRRKVR